MSKKGLYNKYVIEKADGSEIDPNAIYFVLRLDTDRAARKALKTYALETENDDLGIQLTILLADLENNRTMR